MSIIVKQRLNYKEAIHLLVNNSSYSPMAAELLIDYIRDFEDNAVFTIDEIVKMGFTEYNEQELIEQYAEYVYLDEGDEFFENLIEYLMDNYVYLENKEQTVFIVQDS